jgi:epoxyqueuosine reductase
LDKATITQQLKEKSRELGFSLVGVTSSDAPEHLDVYKNWLRLGRQGEMHYLETEREIERREDPKRILPECKSILVLGIPYDNPGSLGQMKAGEGRIAAYAWGKDYHEELRPRLKAIVEYAEELVGHPIPNRWYADSGPLLERELAQHAGLGWIGKNTMLINPNKGSYFLLAEILLGLELEVDNPITVDHCGSCRRCIDACPTDCILEDRTLDATRCISYLTIELKGPIPGELRPKMGEWIFGCDICQIVCPWNERFAEPKGDPAFTISQPPVLGEELKLSTGEFNKKFKTSPIRRSKRRGYLRNVSVALGNAAQTVNVQAISNGLADKEALIRGHAAWALGKTGGETAREALKKAAINESDPWVQKEIQNALNP